MMIKKITKSLGAVLAGTMGTIGAGYGLLLVEDVPWSCCHSVSTGVYRLCLPTSLSGLGEATCTTGESYLVISGPEQYRRVMGRRAPADMDWSNSHLLAITMGMPTGNDWKLHIDDVKLDTITVAGKPVHRTLCIHAVAYQWTSLYQVGDNYRVETTPTRVIKLPMPADAYDDVRVTIWDYPDSSYLIREPWMGHTTPPMHMAHYKHHRKGMKGMEAPAPMPQEAMPTPPQGMGPEEMAAPGEMMPSAPAEQPTEMAPAPGGMGAPTATETTTESTMSTTETTPAPSEMTPPAPAEKPAEMAPAPGGMGAPTATETTTESTTSTTETTPAPAGANESATPQ